MIGLFVFATERLALNRTCPQAARLSECLFGQLITYA